MDFDYIERIKKVKNDKKITNEQLADMTGIAVSTLSKIMAGISDSPKLSNICAICEALGCSVNYIVTGEPENTNNYTLEDSEIRLIEDFRNLDQHGREMTTMVLNKELERVNYGVYSQENRTLPARSRAKILSNPKIPVRTETDVDVNGKRGIMLYDMPVSAGNGVYLDESTAVEIHIPYMDKTANADYALRISGNSMEPKYHNGDVLLIEESDAVEYGELGIFILDGSGYFKRYGGDRLISLNPDYGPIMLKDFSNVQCVGRVIGKIKKK